MGRSPRLQAAFACAAPLVILAIPAPAAAQEEDAAPSEQLRLPTIPPPAPPRVVAPPPPPAPPSMVIPPPAPPLPRRVVPPAAPPAPPRPQSANSRQTAPIPVTSPRSWILSQDYPAAALREEMQGTTDFSLSVDAGGTPTHCVVTHGSGSAELDEAACRLLMQRARFYPATNGDGDAVAATWRSRVRWQIPEDEPPLPPSPPLPPRKPPPASVGPK